MKKSLTTLLLAHLAGPAFGNLYIYEPFDYEPTTEVNENGYFGDGNQAGGLGLGEWVQRDNPGNEPPVNEGDVADEGVTFMDSGGNELPVAGNAYERRQRVGQVACSSPVESSATQALTADGTTMWMTFLFQDFGFSGPDFGLGLNSEKMVGDDNQGLEAPGFGVGLGIVSTGGQSRNICTAVYDNATGATRQFEETPTFNGPGDSPVYFLAMKVNWNPSGTPDEIFVFIIDDLTTEPDEADALASDTFDWDLETQQSLDVLNFSDTQVGYVDEIRIGTTFSAVTTGVSGPTGGPKITALDYAPAEDTVTLTWDSSEGASYTVTWSGDLINWDSDLEDSIPADLGETTTKTFNLTDAGVPPSTKLFFRVEEE